MESPLSPNHSFLGEKETGIAIVCPVFLGFGVTSPIPFIAFSAKI
jgi:hypothetical protein